jgi:hypothetical protein
MRARVEFFLNILLILGALTSILTIEGGRWWIDRLVWDNASAAAPAVDAVRMRAIINVVDAPAAAIAPRPTPVCPQTPAPHVANWDQPYLMNGVTPGGGLTISSNGGC